MRGHLPLGARRGRRLRHRPRLRRAVRAALDRGRPRHAARGADDGRRRDRGCCRRRRRRRSTSGWSAPRWSTTRSASSGSTAAICVTASHNPKEYTGMKIVRRGALPVGGDSGLEEVRDARCAASSARSSARRDPRPRTSGTRSSTSVLSFIDGEADPPAAGGGRRGERDGRHDAAAGARAAAAARCRALLLRARRLVPEPRAEPAAPREPRVHRREDPEEGADLGVAYDGDADRCFFVDDTGEFVPGDFVTALFARGDAREGAGRQGDLRRAR